ncbi:hypothetical protein TNCV_2697201 [Trichonephila clavipes]|nr:hypothetical protein TNCV_2697201 [Trichonephila clavipes]
MRIVPKDRLNVHQPHCMVGLECLFDIGERKHQSRQKPPSSPNFLTTPQDIRAGGHLSFNRFNIHQPPIHGRSSEILLKMDKWLKRRKFNDDNSDNDNVRDQVNEQTPAQAQVASYEIAELIAVNLKPHNLAEEIILPACRKIVKTMIGGSADNDICKIPLSDYTIHRRIKDMSENIEQNTAKNSCKFEFCSTSRRNNRYYRKCSINCIR